MIKLLISWVTYWIHYAAYESLEFMYRVTGILVEVASQNKLTKKDIIVYILFYVCIIVLLNMEP